MLARARLVVAALVLLGLPGSVARAQERVTIEHPPPKSISDIEPVMQISFAQQGESELVTRALRDALQDTPPVLRDARIRANLRTAYFRSDDFDG